MASGVVLGIRLGFNHHAPEQAAVLLAFHQQATNQVGGDQLGGAGEEGLGERWDVVGGRGGYRSGFITQRMQASPQAWRRNQKELKEYLNKIHAQARTKPGSTGSSKDACIILKVRLQTLEHAKVNAKSHFFKRVNQRSSNASPSSLTCTQKAELHTGVRDEPCSSNVFGIKLSSPCSNRT